MDHYETLISNVFILINNSGFYYLFLSRIKTDDYEFINIEKRVLLFFNYGPITTF